MLVQFCIIGLGNEHRVVIEKMYFLLIAHADVRMPAQKVVQRRRAGLLRAGQNKVEPLNFATLDPKHRWEVIQRTTIGEGAASRTHTNAFAYLAIRKSARALAHSKTWP
ncbi:MAG: hypothetical protein DMF08_06525 [Verrucomicrobia bacterium]|nr:MAG: hypothetical protein DMF08_06525 [Verrucomicrobiota bacterium]